MTIRKTMALLALAGLCGAGAFAARAEDGEAASAEQELTPRARAAIERGLRYLASIQNPDGSWSCLIGAKVGEQYSVHSPGPEKHPGVSALACLAFLANGNTPGRGKYGRALSRGLDYVLTQVGPDGWVGSNNTRMYSHAFATLFLGEICGMADRKEVRDKLKLAVQLIIRSQNELGGWRYLPMDRDSDISVTVSCVQALRVARNNGIHVPAETIDRAMNYILSSQVRRAPYPFMNGGFKYQPLDTDDLHNRITYSLTAAGLVSLYQLGVYHDDRIQAALAFLDREENRLPIAPWGPRRMPRQGEFIPYNYFYGNYYGAQALFQAGGVHWRRGFARLREELCALQQSDGSWRDAVGPSYATAMACILLQFPYRYLPILQR